MTPVAMTTINLQEIKAFKNAGVAFVKGVNERNNFFEKINNQ